MRFRNRQEAGRLLAKAVKKLVHKNEDGVVLGIPRGGVVVAKEVARVLDWPLDIIVAKKISVPGNAELAMGAVCGEAVVLDREMIERLGLSEEKVEEQVQSAKCKVQNYNAKFKVKKLDFDGKTVVIVDDGVATGATMEAAIKATQASRFKVQGSRFKAKIILATPVIAKDTLEKLRPLVNEVVYLLAPADFLAVGQFYENFEQVSDEEVGRSVRA